tara:strand:+ start:172 stop:600 length:429 start_codon:yes stop_codon:yes gene_type:complete
MKQSSWEECISTNFSLKITADKAKAQVLLKTAKGRNEYLKENTIKESNANYIFEGYYSSILEALHALLLVDGYKVSNHICLGFYLRDICKREDLFRMFDDCRYKRNSLIYYGRTMEFSVAKEAITKCKEFFDKIEKLVKERL